MTEKLAIIEPLRPNSGGSQLYIRDKDNIKWEPLKAYVSYFTFIDKNLYSISVHIEGEKANILIKLLNYLNNNNIEWVGAEECDEDLVMSLDINISQFTYLE